MLNSLISCRWPRHTSYHTYIPPSPDASDALHLKSPQLIPCRAHTIPSSAGGTILWVTGYDRRECPVTPTPTTESRSDDVVFPTTLSARPSLTLVIPHPAAIRRRPIEANWLRKKGLRILQWGRPSGRRSIRNPAHLRCAGGAAS